MVFKEITVFSMSTSAALTEHGESNCCSLLIDIRRQEWNNGMSAIMLLLSQSHLSTSPSLTICIRNQTMNEISKIKT